MGLSKANRIFLLLVIDTAFFLLELIVGELPLVPYYYYYLLTISTGYAVHSLALVADSFHMVRVFSYYIYIYIGKL